MKVHRKATSRPIDIIQPKSMTGLMSHSTKEPKPMMLVSTVYSEGRAISATVRRTSSN